MIQLSSNQVKFCICSCSIFPCYLWPDLNFKLSSFCILILTVTLLLLVDWISNSRAIIFFIKQSKHFLFNKILHLYHLMFDSKRKKRTLTFPIFYALVIPTDLRKRPSNINKDRISLPYMNLWHHSFDLDSKHMTVCFITIIIFHFITQTTFNVLMVNLIVFLQNTSERK